MTTQLATTDAPKKASVSSGNQLSAFVPTSLDEAWRLAGALASSGMTPKTYGSDQNKCMVGILAGAEVGLTPFAALQSIAVINGNPSLWGDGMLALVQASGFLEDFEETDDGTTATCRVVRAGRKTPTIQTFSMDDAKKAGLAGKAGPWTQYTRRMRQMRARGFALRDAFPDILKGLKLAEEARDYAHVDGGVIEHAAPLSANMLIEQATGHAAEVVDAETGEASTDPAADWTTTHLEAIANAESLDAIGTIETRAATKLAKRPELLAKVQTGAGIRREELTPEGKPDADRGEAFAGFDPADFDDETGEVE